MNNLPDILEQIKTHIQKKTRKRLNNGVYPADLGRRVKKKTQKRLVKALGSDFTWLQ